MAGALAACAGDETVTAYGAEGRSFALVELDGAPFPASASISFPAAGRVAGQAPCNSYFAPITVPYPWFEVGLIGASKRACPDLAAESRFFVALRAMTLSEISGDVLILSDPESGRRMVFQTEGSAATR